MTPAPPAALLLPTALERKEVFYTLKRWSSYAAWNRILGFYQAWADAMEKGLRAAAEKGWEDKSRLHESDYVLILKGLAQCDDGVARLRKGDKRVFRSDFNGDFRRASHGAFAYWTKAYLYIESGDIAGGNEFTPYWDEFIAALLDLAAAWTECSTDILEPEADQSQATRTFMHRYLRERFPRMTFPEPLPDVPDPIETVLVRTGKDVPCSGIWEPVEVPSRTIVSLFKAEPPKGPFLLAGTMSYLHGGISAPPMRSYGKVDGESSTWRLLWRDDRYVDGSIPEEEKSYTFLEPDARDEASTTAPSSAGITVLDSGQRTPMAGRWALQDSLTVAVELAEGEALPLHQGRPARWVLIVG